MCSCQAVFRQLGEQRQAVKKLEDACQKQVDKLLKQMEQEGRSGYADDRNYTSYGITRAEHQ